MLRAALAGLSVLLLATAAGAQPAAPKLTACFPDAVRFCPGSLLVSRARTARCMNAHLEELSGACRAAINVRNETLKGQPDPLLAQPETRAAAGNTQGGR
jgi:hypothetical protein